MLTKNLIKETADAIVSSGMKDAGYQYVVIDDCWHGTRDAKGFIQPNPQRFPSGMKALGDYIHAKGLKFGIYSDVGAKTCGGQPGSRGHEYQDALTYASWGVDYLKYDWCNSEGINPVGAYTTMRDALYATGRPIVFSICEWGDNKPWEWAKPIGNLWRTTGDIYALLGLRRKSRFVVELGNYADLGQAKGFANSRRARALERSRYDGSRQWMTVSEDRAHFSLWAMLAAPLIAGNDVRNMTKETREILTNKEVIAIDQDSLGIQGFPAITEDDLEIWVKPLANDEWAVCFLNRGNVAKNINFDWKENFIKDDNFQKQFDAKKTTYKVRDLWAKKDLGTTATALKTALPAHAVAMLRLTK